MIESVSGYRILLSILHFISPAPGSGRSRYRSIRGFARVRSATLWGDRAAGHSCCGRHSRTLHSSTSWQRSIAHIWSSLNFSLPTAKASRKLSCRDDYLAGAPCPMPTLHGRRCLPVMVPVRKMVWLFLPPREPRLRLSSYCIVSTVSATTRMMWLRFSAGTIRMLCCFKYCRCVVRSDMLARWQLYQLAARWC